MSKLRQKSNFNLDAANTLLKHYLYAPSIHCSYYSCFQLLEYTIKNFFDEDYKTQETEICSKKKNTHQYVINYIYKKLKSYLDNSESRKFKRRIKDLENLRIDSDYNNIEITSEKGYDAMDKAKILRNYIIKTFYV